MVGNNTREADRLVGATTSPTLLYGAWYDPQAFIESRQVCGPFLLCSMGNETVSQTFAGLPVLLLHKDNIRIWRQFETLHSPKKIRAVASATLYGAP